MLWRVLFVIVGVVLAFVVFAIPTTWSTAPRFDVVAVLFFAGSGYFIGRTIELCVGVWLFQSWENGARTALEPMKGYPATVYLLRRATTEREMGAYLYQEKGVRKSLPLNPRVLTERPRAGISAVHYVRRYRIRGWRRLFGDTVEKKHVFLVPAGGFFEEPFKEVN